MGEISPLLVVDDVEAAIAYYSDSLGFTPDFVFPQPVPVFATLRFEGARVMLEAAKNYVAKGGIDLPAAERGVGVELYVNVSGDIDDYYNKMQKAGVDIARAIITTDYGMRQFTIRDLNGYVLTFIKHLAG